MYVHTVLYFSPLFAVTLKDKAWLLTGKGRKVQKTETAYCKKTLWLHPNIKIIPLPLLIITLVTSLQHLEDSGDRRWSHLKEYWCSWWYHENLPCPPGTSLYSIGLFFLLSMKSLYYCILNSTKILLAFRASSSRTNLFTFGLTIPMQNSFEYVLSISKRKDLHLPQLSGTTKI